MAIRIYRAPTSAPPANTAQATVAHRPNKARISGRSFVAVSAADSFEDPHADSHIVERKVKKENRAGRRELEAVRRQQRELREDTDFEYDER